MLRNLRNANKKISRTTINHPPIKQCRLINNKRPRVIDDEKRWYREHIEEIHREFMHKYVAVAYGKIVVACDDLNEFLNQCEQWQKENPNTPYYSTEVGRENVRGYSEVLPIDSLFFSPDMQSSSLSYASIFHPREFEIDPQFKTEGRFQDGAGTKRHLFRPIISTLVSHASLPSAPQKIISFLVDTGSPFSFICDSAAINLGLPPPQMSPQEFNVRKANLFGETHWLAVSSHHWSAINILGADIMWDKHLIVDFKEKLLTLDNN